MYSGLISWGEPELREAAYKIGNIKNTDNRLTRQQQHSGGGVG